MVVSWPELYTFAFAVSKPSLCRISSIRLYSSSGVLNIFLRWNSGIFDQLTANDYIAVLVTEKFLQGGNWTSYAMYDPQIHSLQNNKTLDRFDNDACIRAYSSSPFVAHRKNLLLVSDAVNDTNTVLQVRYAGIEGTGTHYEWMCESSTTGNLDKNGICYPNVVIQHAADWQPFLGELSENGVTSPGRVQYCLSERTIPTFQLGISSDILIAVLICNAVKIACFIATIWIGKTDPLVTTGGAVESFLNEPDVITRGRCNISKRDVTKRKLAWTADCATVPLRWKGQRKSWRRAASVIRWLACFIPYVTLSPSHFHLALFEFSGFYKNRSSMTRKILAAIPQVTTD